VKIFLTIKINSMSHEKNQRLMDAHAKCGLEEKETGTFEVVFKNSGLVAPTGIEPVSKV
jgi:hypothetical protein